MLGCVRLVSTHSLLRSIVSRSAARAPVLTNRHQSFSIRAYASYSNSKKDTPEEPLDRVAQIADNLRQNPEIRVLLEQFQDLLKTKGFDTTKPPSMFEMIKLMSQKDVKEHIVKLKSSMDAANIKFGPEDIQAFMSFYKTQK